MAIVRINKTNNYTVMSNYHFKEKNMSLKAKGLLSLMLSLPDNWDYSVSGLVSICKENKTAIQTTLKELEQFGYLKRERLQDEKGKFYYVYDVYELPRTENLCTDDLCTENQLQLNTKELNTNGLSTNSKKERKKKEQPKQIHTDKKENKENNTCRKTYNQIIEEYTDNEVLRNELKENLKTRKMKKALPTNHGLLSDLKDLDSISLSTLEKIEIVKKSNERGWASFYPLNEYDSNHRLSFDKLKEYDC